MADRNSPSAPGLLIDENDEERVGRAADFMTLARSPVIRDWNNREVIQVYQAEQPGRAFLELQRLLCGLLVIGVPKKTALAYVSRVALGSIPRLRRAIIEVISKASDGYVPPIRSKNSLMTGGGSTIDRALKDLTRSTTYLEKYQSSDNYWTFTPLASDNYWIGFEGVET